MWKQVSEEYLKKLVGCKITSLVDTIQYPIHGMANQLVGLAHSGTAKDDQTEQRDVSDVDVDVDKTKVEWSASHKQHIGYVGYDQNEDHKEKVEKAWCKTIVVIHLLHQPVVTNIELQYLAVEHVS